MTRPVRGLTHASPVRGSNGHAPRRVRESALALSYPAGPWASPDFYGNGWLSPGYLGAGGVWGYPRERSKSHPAEPGGVMTETEWRGSMLLSRSLCEHNELAIGFLSHVVNFVVGDGLTWEVVLRGGQPGAVVTAGDDTDPAVSRCQEYLDEWRAFAGWGAGAASFDPDDLDGADATAACDRQREAVKRSSREGEAIVRLFEGGPGDDGLPSVRFVEPEQVRSPSGAGPDSDWYMGVKNVADDAEAREAYWFSENLDSTKGELVPAGRIVHLKANVDGVVKRGVSDFFSVAESLSVVRRILANIGETTSTLSRYLWIQEHAPGVTSAAAQSLIDGQANFNALTIDPPSWDGSSVMGRQYGVKQLTGPTIEHTSNGQKVADVPGVHSDAFIATVQAKLRAAGMRWGAPEYFSGDASNANFASTQVAGGPFVRAVEARQADVCRFEQAVAMRVLAFGVRSGRIRRDDFERVTVNVNPSAVAIANRKEETDRRMALLDKRVVSPQTIAQEEGYDPKVEAANWKAWDQSNPPQPPPGMGGLGGDQPPGGGPAGGGGGGLFESVGPPPRPGLVFDRSRHRWVRPEDVVADAGPTPTAKDIQSKGHKLEDVIAGRQSVGVEGRGGKDMANAQAAGLYTSTVAGVPIYARDAAAAKTLEDYLSGGGRYGTPEFSRLLGYSEEEVEQYSRFLAAEGQHELLTHDERRGYRRGVNESADAGAVAGLPDNMEYSLGGGRAIHTGGETGGVRLVGRRTTEGGGGGYSDETGRTARESVSPDGPELTPGLVYVTEASGKKTPFTGRITDKLGRARCYSAGRAVPCASLPDDHAAAGARENAKRVLRDPSSASPDDVRDLVKTLRGLGAEELKRVAAEYGVRHKGKLKPDRVNALVEYAKGRAKPAVVTTPEPAEPKAGTDRDRDLAAFASDVYLQRGIALAKTDFFDSDEVQPITAKLERENPEFKRLLARLEKMSEKDVEDESHPVNRRMNELVVGAALEAGIKVPPEVLADYPDLAAKGKAAGKPAPPARVDHTDPPAMAREMKSVGQSLPSWNGRPFDPSAGAWQSHKVLISDLYDAMAPRMPGVSLDEFKDRLRADHLQALHRIDMPQAARDVDALGRSATANRLGQAGGYHLVDVTRL